MATINEMRQVATQIENETQVGGNTASRVGGLFNDIVDELEKIDEITPLDETPTKGSVKGVTSGSIYNENLQNGIAYFTGYKKPIFSEIWNANAKTITITLPDATFRIYDSNGTANVFTSIVGTYTITTLQMLVYNRIDNIAEVINLGNVNSDKYYILLGIPVEAVYGLLAPYYYSWKDKSDYIAYLPSGQKFNGKFYGDAYNILASETNFNIRVYDKGFANYISITLNEDYTIPPAKALIIDLADNNAVKIIDFTALNIFDNKIALLINLRNGLKGLLAAHVYTLEMNKINVQKADYNFVTNYNLSNIYKNKLSGGLTPSSTTIGDSITVSFYNSAAYDNVTLYCKAGTKLFVDMAGGSTARPAILVVNAQGVLKDKINSISGQSEITIAEDSMVYINLWSETSTAYKPNNRIFSTQDELDFSYNLFNENICNPYGITVNGVTIGGTATPTGIYDNAGHTYRSVGIILYKGETVKFYKMAGASNRPAFNIIDIKTSKLLYNTYANYANYYTATTDCYIISNSSALTQTPFISIANVDEGEARRRITYLLNIENPLYNGKNNGEDIDFYIDNDELVRLKTILGSHNSPAEKTVSLIHFSDLHGSVVGLKSILNFKEKYGGSINDILNTGDTVNSYYADGTWESLAAVEGIGTIMNTVGNHDGSVFSNNTHNWEGVPKTDVYNRYFKPYISNWGVVQPNDAELNGYCYYYKDYPTQKLRLIVLDDIMSDYTAQTAWLIEVLADARTKQYSVVIAQHSRPAGQMQIINGFNSIYEPEIFYANNPARDAVDDFIDAGGDFVCWLLGHTHFDATRIITDHHNQIIVVISAMTTPSSNYVRGNLTEQMVLFNAISFNTESKLIKVMRVGAHIDNCMQDNKSFCINWQTKDGWKSN